ncbi:MAG TPA: elongation factor P maturation arginine rhamnosyltransferase EarP [Casimicrobiaceae bacterium]|nr:elongation factor P maturation arginine rhamnosyltransferase EarP [Casimicrobiaceae bacterium]
MSRLRADVFCRVVDNYGDAGVCWRLSRQFASEHAIDVTLWIDQLAALARMEPAIDPQRDMQSVAGVNVRRLDESDAPASIPDIVVEAFGCGLPACYLDAMAQSARPSVWFNLEYLSAEPWIDSTHGLASVHPQLGITRYFWFPGFTPKTGGLIRERGLSKARDAWRARNTGASDALRVILFCYPNRALPALFDVWAESDRAVRCTIPEGVATAALDRWLGGDVPHAGTPIVRDHLTIDIVPFVGQDAFDRMLWDADVNFVRGEDSFVRAQWAARAFVWQPYPQAEDAHRAKLDAFLSRYVATLDASVARAATSFWHAFNNHDAQTIAGAWRDFEAVLPSLQAQGERWSRELTMLPELGTGMVDFARGRL